MTSSTPTLPDSDLAAFMEDGVSISLAACGRDGLPSVARATGFRHAPGSGKVRVMVSRLQAAQVLRDLEASGAVAVTFSRPSTHRTLQLKGRDAAVEAATPEDLAAVACYRAAFIAELEPLGFAPALIGALVACPDEDVVTLSFTPSSAWSQTPGPDAGRAIGTAP